MEAGDFKDFAKAMTDYIAEYLENIRDRWVFYHIGIFYKSSTIIPIWRLPMMRFDLGILVWKVRAPELTR